MKPSRLANSITRLDTVAEQIARIPPYKQLAAESGLSQKYVNNLMSKLIRLHRAGVKVSHETLRSSLATDKSFSELLDSAPGRTVTPARSESVAPHTPTASAPNSHEQHR